MSSTVAQWELALRLKGRRAEKGLSAGAVAKELGFTRNYLSLVEHARTNLSEPKFDQLVDLYDFSAEDTAIIARLRSESKQSGWWAKYSDVLAPTLIRYLGLEAGSESISAYESSIFNGLLQNEQYSYHLIKSSPQVARMQIHPLREVRRHRRLSVGTPSGPKIMCVMNEAGLRQHVGPPGVLIDQLDYVIDLIHRLEDTVELRVLPFTSSAGGSVAGGTLHLLEFASEILPLVAWVETAFNTTGVADDPAQIRLAQATLELAAEEALSRQDSLELIKQVAEEIKAEHS